MIARSRYTSSRKRGEEVCLYCINVVVSVCSFLFLGSFLWLYIFCLSRRCRSSGSRNLPKTMLFVLAVRDALHIVNSGTWLLPVEGCDVFFF